MADQHTATVNGRDLPISTKQAVEICNAIRGKSLQVSRRLLQDVMTHKRAIAYTRHKRDIPHRAGRMAAGRYPEKASRTILRLIDALEANAQNKGLDTDTLVLTIAIPNQGSRPWHFGRLRRRKMKRTHIHLRVEEKTQDKNKREQKTTPSPQAQPAKQQKKGAQTKP